MKYFPQSDKRPAATCIKDTIAVLREINRSDGWLHDPTRFRDCPPGVAEQLKAAANALHDAAAHLECAEYAMLEGEAPQ